MQDFDALKELSQMLETEENGINDWRQLAHEWKYPHSEIKTLKKAAKRSHDTGLGLLFEKDNAEHTGKRNLEHLLDGLDKIKREDAAQFLSKYILKKFKERTFVPS